MPLVYVVLENSEKNIPRDVKIRKILSKVSGFLVESVKEYDLK